MLSEAERKKESNHFLKHKNDTMIARDLHIAKLYSFEASIPMHDRSIPGHHRIQSFRRVVEVSDEDLLKNFIHLRGGKVLRSRTKGFNSFNILLKRGHEIIRGLMKGFFQVARHYPDCRWQWARLRMSQLRDQSERLLGSKNILPSVSRSQSKVL